MLPHQAHAPGERVAPAAGYARVDQRVQDQPLRLPEPGHHRHGEGGEHHLLVVTDDPPGHLAAEPVLGLPGDLDPLLAGVLAEPAAAAFGGRRPLHVGYLLGRVRGWQNANDRDLLAIMLDLRRLGEPVTGHAAAEPATELLGGRA